MTTTREREKALEKIKKLIELKESQNHVKTNREGERKAAELKINNIIDKYDIKEIEILINRLINEEAYKTLKRSYGPYTDYIYFMDEWEEIEKIRPKSAYYCCFYNKDKQNVLFAKTLKRPVPEIHLDELDNKVTFKDKKLEDKIREEINLDREDILVRDLNEIVKLDISGCHIKKLNGINYCYNLRILDASNNKIKVVAPLEPLFHLYILNISNNLIVDISILGSCENIRTLIARGLDFLDLNPLFMLPNLLELEIDWHHYPEEKYLFKKYLNKKNYSTKTNKW